MIRLVDKNYNRECRQCESQGYNSADVSYTPINFYWLTFGIEQRTTVKICARCLNQLKSEIERIKNE